MSETCSKSLKVLDIERSQQVKDDSIPYINACKQLIKINIFGIAIDFNGMVRYFLVNISITILWLELQFVKSKFKSCRQWEEKVHIIQVHVQKRKSESLSLYNVWNWQTTLFYKSLPEAAAATGLKNSWAFVQKLLHIYSLLRLCILNITSPS